MNRLAGEKSPYLLSAASQPVHWRPWGAEAFQSAKEQNKPILLDIGAVWCHWCHVIDRESYENEETAAIINSRYIAIKVDRDERPDVDARYQRQVSSLSGQGGWPLTAFLTPEGKTFFGGTYFPPTDSGGRPGFPFVLKQVADFYASGGGKAEKVAEQLASAIAASVSAPGVGEISRETITTFLKNIARQHDTRFGGFGAAPKFFHCSAQELLMRGYKSSGNPAYSEVAKKNLYEMALGGVYDQLAGGFHRYSVDEGWRVPHFEKMTYDNGELLKIYSWGASLFEEPFFSRTAKDIVRFVTENLCDRENGGFYSSCDADMDLRDDGDYYTWTLAEAASVLDDTELQAARFHFGIRERGDMTHDPSRCVLYRRASISETAEEMKLSDEQTVELVESVKAKLLNARKARRAPFVDKTMYANWNAMMISGFAACWGATGKSLILLEAVRAYERFRGENGFASGLLRIIGGQMDGFLDDYAWFALAALDLFEATGEEKYLSDARTLADSLITKFRDKERGGYFDCVQTNDPALGGDIHKPYQDSPSSSANAVAAMVMIRLFHHTGETLYKSEAELALKSGPDDMAKHALHYAAMASAMDAHYADWVEIVVCGSGQWAEEMTRTAMSVYLPNRTIKRVIPGGLLRNVEPDTEAKMSAGLGVYVCKEGTCHAPVKTKEELYFLLKSF